METLPELLIVAAPFLFYGFVFGFAWVFERVFPTKKDLLL